MDIKLKMFFDLERSARVLEHGVYKGIPTYVLRKMGEPSVRSDLCQRLETHRYRVAPPHVGLIPKDDGSMRKVYINEPEDRLILHTINDVFCELYSSKIHPKCVSYQKGLSVQKVIKSMCDEMQKAQSSTEKVKYKMIKADLSKYFDSVNRESLNRMLKELDTGSVLDTVLYDYYNTDLVFDENGQLLSHYKSFAQGCSFAAFLANYGLRHIDAALDSMLTVYYRYSDDLFLMGEESKVDAAVYTLIQMLSPLGLSLNPKKVQEIKDGDEFVFLGYKLTSDGKHVDLSPNKVKEYKEQVHELTRYKSNNNMLTYNEYTLKKVVHKLLNSTYRGCEIKGNVYGWMDRLSIVTERSTVKMLDEYTKDRLKSVWTGKQNHTHNMNHCSAEILRQCGYVSMVMMYNALVTNKAVYNQLRQEFI